MPERFTQIPVFTPSASDHPDVSRKMKLLKVYQIKYMDTIMNLYKIYGFLNGCMWKLTEKSGRCEQNICELDAVSRYL